MNSKSTVLIVDDEFSIRESFNLILSSNYRVLQSASGEGALKQIADHKIDIVYLDIRMPGMDGIETLKRIKKLSPQTEVIMVTAVNDVQKASSAIKLGAHDYVVKPFDVQKIADLTLDLLRRKGLFMEIRGLEKKIIPPLAGRSEKIKKVLSEIDRAANSAQNVLIIGEAGVERAWVAYLIYQNGETSVTFTQEDASGKTIGYLENKLLSLSTGATTADLKKGSSTFSDAGILFLDNADTVPHETIEKFLKINARIILGAAGEIKGCEEFIKIAIPPLRERMSDIPLLVEHFLNEAKVKYNVRVKEFMPEALDALAAYAWPGNVLELKAVICKVAVSQKHPIIETRDLPLNMLISQGNHILAFDDIYEEFEKDLVKSIVEASSGDREKAAKLLGIHPHVLAAKI